MGNEIQELISQYNLYNADDKLVGMSTITLPTLDPVTETISGAGILGEYETSAPGAFGSIEMEIPFRCFNKDAAKLLDAEGTMLFLRAAIQVRDTATSKVVQKQVKVTISGNSKGCTIGNAESTKQMESSVKLEVLAFKYEYDGKVLMDLDKLNMKYVVNGVDQMAEIRAMI